VLKFVTLFLKNLARNKLRTLLTALAVVVLVSVYTFASTVTDTVNQLVAAHSSQTRLMVREKWVMPSKFPIRYIPKIADIEGVEDWTVWHFYGGYFDDAGHAGAGIATRVDNLREMHPGMEDLDPALLESMRQEKTGVLMGRWILDQMNWKVGQKFTVMSFTHLGKNLEFKILGVLPSDLWARNFFFRKDYFQEAVGDKDTANLVWLRVSDAETGKRVAAEIEQRFASSPAKLRVETESAGVGRFMSRTNTVVNIINFVVAILLLDMVIVLANSINMTVRERRREIAIMKILGFEPSFILLMIVGEAVTVGAASGLLGAGLAFVISTLNASGDLPVRIAFLLEFPIPAKFMLHGFVVGALVGFAGSVIPAWHARKVRVAEAFANEE
jgi:putative ABC transport system permease protein